MAELKKDFTRGQENAQDGLNENFETIEKGLTESIFAANGATQTGSAKSDTAVLFKQGTERSNNPLADPIFKVNSKGNLTCLKAGTYLMQFSNWMQPLSEVNGYLYYNLKINGSRPSNSRVGGIGTNSIRNRNDFYGSCLVDVPENGEVSIVTETNISIDFTTFGVSIITITRVY